MSCDHTAWIVRICIPVPVDFPSHSSARGEPQVTDVLLVHHCHCESANHLTGLYASSHSYAFTRFIARSSNGLGRRFGTMHRAQLDSRFH